MTREAAFKLISAVADAGFSCQVTIGVHQGMSPAEHCSVHAHAMRFEAVKLQQLMEIGSAHGVELHLVGADLQFVAPAKFPELKL